MLIRRSRSPVDLRTLPIDAFDMYLLSRIEESHEITLAELVALTPRKTLDTVERVEALVKLGVLEFHQTLKRDTVLDGVEEDDEEAMTLRPPPQPKRTR